MYPLLLDLRDVPVLVVGGGNVAERKVGSLLAAGAKVTLIAPEATDLLRQLVGKGELCWIQRPFATNDMVGFRLVFATTDNRSLNCQVAEEARRLGVWVNVADSAEESTFLVPSMVRRGSLTIAVSTEGKSPLLARHIREELQTRYGDEYTLLLELLAETRERAEALIPIQPARQRLYEAILETDILSLLREGNVGAARKRIQTLLAAHSRKNGRQ